MSISNPSGTLTIESNWIRDARRRYRALDRALISRLEGDLFINANLSTERQVAFMLWLEIELAKITGASGAQGWQAKYIEQVYVRAIARQQASIAAQGGAAIAADVSLLAGFTGFTATPSLTTAYDAAMVARMPIHQDALAHIFTKSYETLKGWNDTLARDVRQISFDAVKSGIGTRHLSKQIREATGVTRRRAELIARTETGQAYKESAINEIDRLSDVAKEPLDCRWISALSTTTRHRHASWHGEVISTEEARKRKSGEYQKSDIFNCKCTIIPVVPGFGDTDAKNAKFDAQREIYMKKEAGL